MTSDDSHDIYTIAVICKAPSHEKRISQVALLGHSAKWEIWPHGGGASTQVLTRDNRVLNRFDPAHEQDIVRGGNRVRFQMRCKLCGLNVTLRQGRLDSIADELERHDIRTLDLNALAAIA